eukprot:tig00021238_g19552.t1
MGREAKRGAAKKTKEHKQPRDNDLVKKLGDQVRLKGFRIVDVVGDGNCLFRSIADQLCGSQHRHAEYRKRIMDYIAARPDEYAPFMEDDKSFEQYVGEMQEDGEWGGQLEIVAACNAYRVNVVIHQVDSPAWEIVNFERAPTMHLAYFSHEHYGSEAAVCRASGCEDLARIREAIDECCGDVDAAAELLTFRMRSRGGPGLINRGPPPPPPRAPSPPRSVREEKGNKKLSNRQRQQQEKERRRAFEAEAARRQRSDHDAQGAEELGAYMGALRL